MKEEYNNKGYLLEDFRLFHLKDVQGADADYHYHEFYKVLFLVSGMGGYYIEGKRYLLKAGDIVLIGNHCVHRPEFESGVPYERAILYISPEFLREQSTADCDLTKIFEESAGHVFRPREEIRQDLFTKMAELENVLKNMDYGRTIVSNSILLRILVEIGRDFLSDSQQKPEPMLPKSQRMLAIVRFLDAHLTEEIRIDDLAERFFLSRYHMMRRFKEETGTTIHTYLSERRLLFARDLIAKGVPATEACFQCGFGSYASFARAYGKFFGTTPTGRKHGIILLEEDFE